MRCPLPPSLLALFLFTPACYVAETTVHHPFPAEKMSGLVPGKTTAQEVANLLGAPARVVELGFGSAWLYEHSVTKDAALWLLIVASRGADTQTDRIWVFFNEAGTLTHAAGTFEAATAEYEIPGFG